FCYIFFFQAEDGIRDFHVTGVQTCALPISATDLISSTIARLPIQIYKKGTKGEQVILDEDRRYKILNKEPNSNMSGINLKKRIVMDYLLHGNSYLIPEWNRKDRKSVV